MNDADRRLAAIAALQRQVVTRDQALAAGLSHSGISRRVASGLLVVHGPRTLHFVGSSLDWRGRLLAGLLDLGDGALVTGRSAAALHGLDGFEEGPLQFLVPAGLRRRRPVGRVFSTPSIGPLDRATVDGLAVTSGTRTVLELIGRVSERELGNALDSALRKGVTAPAMLLRRLDELGRQGRRGVAAFDRVMGSAGVQSWLERQFLRADRAGRAPAPRPPADVPARRPARRSRRLRLRAVARPRRGRRAAGLPQRRRAPPAGASAQRAPAPRQGRLLLHHRGRDRRRRLRHRHRPSGPPAGGRGVSWRGMHVSCRKPQSEVHGCRCNNGVGAGVQAERLAGRAGRRRGQRATKYLARGWWQMMAEVVCSGWYCQPVSSLTSMPRRSAPSRRATVALSSRSGQAG